ncbi:MAG: DUF2119 domain-containing protein [Methanosarcinales archaeon]|nr:DUF2119 domain-containing protein [Methanosarcinales archaeon]
MLKRYGSGAPVRLLVAGLHGDEWRSTSKRLKGLTTPTLGTLLVMLKVSDREYMSTLDKDYYIKYAPLLLDAIRTYRPQIYLELHSYSSRNFAVLTDKGRLEQEGIPAYIEIESGILMGSVSPHIRVDYFSPYDLCISFEMPKHPSEESLRVIDRLVGVVKECESRSDFVEYMKKHYPRQTSAAIKNYLRFYGHLY